MSLEYWDEIYKNVKEIKTDEAQWLDTYAAILSESEGKPIIDLGCGFGCDSIHLINNGYSVISCDFSKIILDKLVSFDSRIIPKQFDLREGLPFRDAEVHILLASLSLHYFTLKKTKEILSEIERVLDSNGYLICRVNSVNDKNYGAGGGTEIEKDFYHINGNYKRFFTVESIDNLFQNWNILVKKECTIERFSKPKKAWEIVVRKR